MRVRVGPEAWIDPARDRQPLQPDAEDDDQDQAEPERRDRDADQRAEGARRSRVDRPRCVAARSPPPDRSRYRSAMRDHRQLDRGREAGEDLVGHRRVRPVGPAQIAVNRAGQEIEVLDRQRPIQAHLMAQCGDRLPGRPARRA